MGRPKLFLAMFVFSVLLVSVGTSCGSTDEKIYFTSEYEGKIVGYAEVDTSTVMREGRKLMILEEVDRSSSKALGMDIDATVVLTYHIDTETGQFVYHDSDIDQGTVQLSSKVYIVGQEARFEESMLDSVKVISLPEGVILPNTLFYPYLIEAFVEKGRKKAEFQVLDVRETEVLPHSYTKVSEEPLEILGRARDVLVIDEINRGTGLKARYWIDKSNGMALKRRYGNGASAEMTGAGVMDRVKRESIDALITSNAGKMIPDYQEISYMKVVAEIEPYGAWITAEGLNVPGQRFEGTVEDNLIKGVFEIEHPRYGGEGAPPFPPDFSGSDSLKRYLEASSTINSDDTVLIERAEEITEGAADSWEAVRMLSKWVSEEIGYSLPGGLTARKTYDIKTGECGAHSVLLAAFCRAVGIPARVVWGGMYIPSKGGMFGQHAWNEIYMGNAGWIPVDATASEIDYVDSGHIRIAQWDRIRISFNAKDMEILDYRLSYDEEKGGEAAERSGEFSAYIGNYTNTVDNSKAVVTAPRGVLTVELPGPAVLALMPPDEEGRWKAKMGHGIHLEFVVDGGDSVESMNFHQLIEMPRVEDEGTEPQEVAGGDYDDCIGKYLFRQLNTEFTVLYDEGSLAIYDPTRQSTIKLREPGEGGWMVDEFGKNAISFKKDEDGEVIALLIDSRAFFKKD